MEQEPTLTVTTPWGELVRWDDQWDVVTEINGVSLEIFVNDVNGVPNPRFLDMLPTLIQLMPALEQKARQTVSEVSPNHQLGSISDVLPYRGSEEMDYSIGFDYSDEDGGETIFVDFKGQDVVSWDKAD